MRALTFYRYGGPEVLRIVDIHKPIPGDYQVLVRVKAVALNDWDYGLIKGRPFVNRSMAGTFLKPKNCIPGSDIAGVVEDVGRFVTRYKKGDRVFGDLSGTESWGGCAEYVCAGEDELAPMGSFLSYQEAAALPQAGMLALQALVDEGELKPGQSMLINGAAGGFGTYSLQIGRALGASYVAGVDHPEKKEMMKDVGFDRILDYTQGEFLNEKRQYDLILDAKTSHPFGRYRNLLKKGGRYVTVGGKTGQLMKLAIFRPFISFFWRREYKIVMLKANRDLEYLKKLYGKGLLKPVLDGSWSFDDIIKAFTYYGEGHCRGKVVVSVG
ncbi:MAG: NAD(P)-dependent alcohol dehydrogenase [Spirochaetales bacterium]|nr:NAD(P)-dependent alcohol dehydrogenase [Spirochaetales bacterium]